MQVLVAISMYRNGFIAFIEDKDQLKFYLEKNKGDWLSENLQDE